jgi:hypothetical protein
MTEYSKEQLLELYEQLPENLKKAVFSVEIGELIKKICDETNSKDSYSAILKQVGYVFLGILSPNEFKEALENPAAFARINNEVFFNFKSDLDPLYGINIEKAEDQNKNPLVKKRAGSDKYLEPIE